MEAAYVHIYYSDEHKIKERLTEKISEIRAAIQCVLKEEGEAGHYEKVLVVSSPLDFVTRNRSKDCLQIEMVVFTGYCRSSVQALSEALTEKIGALLPFSLCISVFSGRSWTPTTKSVQE